MFTSLASFGRTASSVLLLAGAACVLTNSGATAGGGSSRAFVVVDVDGDGLKTCPPASESRLARGEVVVHVVRWTCPGDDDAVVLVQNPGRPISTADLLGLKVGPQDGLEFLARFGASSDQISSRVLVSSDPLFQTIVLWRDANADVTIAAAEVFGFAFAGFDELALNRELEVGGTDIKWTAHATRNGMRHLMASVPFEGQ